MVAVHCTVDDRCRRRCYCSRSLSISFDDMREKKEIDDVKSILPLIACVTFMSCDPEKPVHTETDRQTNRQTEKQKVGEFMNVEKFLRKNVSPRSILPRSVPV